MDERETRSRLQTERQRLAGLIERQRENQAATAESAELSTVDQHDAELGTETFERERDQTALLILQGELADVESALARLESGDYGRCEDCGRPIGKERLEAKPSARFCIDHQARMEREVSARRF
jgi:DnaK suppressor protein